jgi:hypothetical protein
VHRIPLLLLSLVVISSSLTTLPARAQTVLAPDPAVVEQARALFEAGVALSEEERWAEALDAFRRSRALVERPSTVFNIATALQRLGRSGDAIVAVDAFLALADPIRDGAQVDQARALRVALRESLGRVTVRLRPGTAALSVDARPIAADDAESDVRQLLLDPGEHVLEVSAPGFATRTLTIAVSPGVETEQELALDRIAVTPAALTIRASRSDARILVDEEEVGVGNADVEVTTGRHLVRVEALEHRPYQQIVVLAPAERLEIVAPLERVSGGSIVEEPAFWIVTACIVLAGVGAGVGIGVATSGGSPAPYGGTSGVAITGLTTPW